MGVVVESEPYSYETATQKSIPCSFKVHENTVQFFVAPYHGELVIDPALGDATYIRVSCSYPIPQEALPTQRTWQP